MSLRNQLVCALLAIVFAGCSGGGGNQSSSAQPSSSAGAMSTQGAMSAASPGAMSAASPGAMAAAIPSSLNCGAVQPVWVNKRSHVYHEPTDPLYGRTKHGEYMCPAAAVKAGYHKASGKHGRHHSAMGGGTEGTEPSPAAT